MKNKRGSCALALYFLSDGQPSDSLPRLAGMSAGQRQRRRDAGLERTRADGIQARTDTISSRIAELAARFGRRLTVGTIGFAGPSEGFDVLQCVADKALRRL